MLKRHCETRFGLLNLNVIMIIDAHTHISSGADSKTLEIFQKEARKNAVRRILVSNLGNWEQYPSENAVREYNEEARSFAGKSADQIKWLTYLNPQNSNWQAELKESLNSGACGIKLWICLKDQKTGSMERTADVLKAAEKKSVPVVLHTYNRTGSNLPGEINIAEFATLASTVPGCRLIAAHAGGNWRHSLGVLRNASANVYVDICGGYPESGMVAALVADLGAERVVYGSDFTGRSMPSQVAKVLFADISESDRQKILWKNAERIFDFTETETGRNRGDTAFELLDEAASGQKRNLSKLVDLSEDHFCFCGIWPFFATSCLSASKLEQILAEQGTKAAYTADLGSIYRMDLENANRSFLKTTKGLSRVKPLATVNPQAENWREVLQAAKIGFSGIILYPYFHNWRIDADEHLPLFEKCAEMRLKVWVNCMLGDARFQHAGLSCRPVATAEVANYAAGNPVCRVVFQGLSAEQISAVHEKTGGSRNNIRFTLTQLTDGTFALDSFLEKYGSNSLVMGSEYPFRDIKTVAYSAERL